MGTEEMPLVAGLLARALRERADDGALAGIRDEVAALCSKFPPY
jgi:glycine/serine hydroxymethyltransferase